MLTNTGRTEMPSFQRVQLSILGPDTRQLRREPRHTVLQTSPRTPPEDEIHSVHRLLPTYKRGELLPVQCLKERVKYAVQNPKRGWSFLSIL